MLIEILVKTVKFIKIDFLTFLSIEILLNFSVKVLHCTLTTRKLDTTKITFAKKILTVQIFAKFLLI